MLALRQPMAFDLRYVISALKVSASLEKIGDKAKGIIKKIYFLDQKIAVNIKQSLLTMLIIAKNMVKDAVGAFNNHDLEQIQMVLKNDDEIDKIYNNLFELINQDNFSRDEVKILINILFIAKDFERLADYATNIAEITNYVISGEIGEWEIIEIRLVHHSFSEGGN